ncbi:MAG: serine/threonine protein kinase [Sphingobacteriia bacterium]|nr:serine/threonine protein kinase [Sphingobacteriia bacterium]
MTRVVTTLSGARYRLTAKLGSGGQGAVFGADDGRHAVKLLRQRSLVAREALRDRLAMVARLPIDDLGLARPLDRLREPDLGYVMELFTGMVPIEVLLRPPRETRSLAQWYLGGGGLRRRLRVLGRVADLFARLHGRGLVYTDPSPQNIFVSEACTEHEVRLIDTDNLRPASVNGDAYFTPGYGAPELNVGRGPATSLSDAHAFAVIAFQTLALVHPLQGDLVEEGEPELQELAFNGELPWIDHPEDERNRSRHGIARDAVLSRHLGDAFAAAFGPGLKDPTRRPGLTRWAEDLHRAADNTLGCPACSGTFFRTSAKCPWCEAPRPGYLSLDCELWDPERLVASVGKEGWAVKPGTIAQTGTSGRGKARPIDSAVIGTGEQLELTDRFTVGESSDRPQFRLRHRGTDLFIEALVPGPWRLVSADGRGDRDLGQGPAAVPLGAGLSHWFLRTGESNRLHRIIRFRQVEGA